MSFWQELKKPIMALAPMANVTDAAFRRIIAKYGKPDVMWTEFVSADGLARGNKEILLRDLAYDPAERPIVAQFFGARPDYMYEAGRLAVRLGFDGADINMGCPDRAVMKQGGGAALIKDPPLARELITSLRKGAEDEAREKGVPMIGISVKTRVGYNKVELDKWIPELLKENLDALTIHARTMKDLSKVPARWELIKEAVLMRNELQKNSDKKTLIIGNGDVIGLEDAKNKIKETGADGAMLGRAIFGNPFLFSELREQKRPEHSEGLNPSTCSGQADHINVKARLEVMLEHTKLFDELLGDIKNFAIMKKHYKAYVNGFDGAKELRMKLMETKNIGEVKKILNGFSS